MFYSAVNFSTDASIEFDFSTDRNAFQDFVRGEQEAGPNDEGWTNYLDALDKVRTLVLRDVQEQKNS